ncbi:MAG: hypothetical protein WC453_05020, partial [Patescibacteria group bacterium]
SQEESLSRSVVEHTHTENPATPAAPVAEKGKIKRVDAAPTEAGNLRTAETTTTPKDQVSASSENSKSRARTATLHTENPDTPTPATEVKGQINRVEAAPTEAGNLRTVEETITPKDQVAVSKEVAASGTVVSTLHTENGTTPADPVSETGKIKALRLAPTEAGNLRSEEVEETPLNQTAEAGEDDALRTITRKLQTENTSIPSFVSAIYKAKRVDAEPTKSGQYRTVVEEETPKKVQFTYNYPDRYGQVYVYFGLNCKEAEYAAVVATAGLTSNTNNNIRKEPTKYPGLFNYVITKQPYELGTAVTTFFGTLATTTTTLYDRERRADSSDTDNGYKWRLITITLRERLNTGLAESWANIADGDSDSIKPQNKGYINGLPVYRSVKKTRAYGAWSGSASDT